MPLPGFCEQEDWGGGEGGEGGETLERTATQFVEAIPGAGEMGNIFFRELVSVILLLCCCGGIHLCP
jgi:hypothetical protein